MEFFKVWNEEMALTPAGYRLATLHEVTSHSDYINRHGMHPLGMKALGDTDQRMCLLDGFIPYPSEENFHGRESFVECQWRVVVREGSASGSSQFVLRKQLYTPLVVSDQGKKIAFLNATRHGDTEVIYWVLADTPPGERQLLKDLMENNKEFLANASPYYVHMVKRLVSSEFSSLPLETGGCHTVVDFAVEYAVRSQEIENTIAVVELLIEMCPAKIVDKEIFYTESNTSPSTTEEEPEPKCIIPTGPVFLTHETIPIFPGLENKKIKRPYEKSYLDKVAAKAQKEVKCIPMLTKLLSTIPDKLEEHAIKIRPLFGEVFMEAIERRYTIRKNMLQLEEYIGEMKTSFFVKVLGRASKNDSELAKKLLEVWSTAVGSESAELGGEVDIDGKTLFHYAAQMGIVDVLNLVSDNHNLVSDKNIGVVQKRDKFGRSILHLASLRGQSEFCKTCIKDCHLNVEDSDSSGQNSLHFAVKRANVLDVPHVLDVLDVLIGSSLSPMKLIESQDYRGRTSLHLASAKGNIQMIQKLLSRLGTSRMKKYIQATDFFRRTALLVASHRGDREIVSLLLEKGADPLKERDIDGKTALHYAAQAKYPEAALRICELLLNKYEGSPDKQSLLLSASATATGTADEGDGVHSTVQRFLATKRNATKDEDLLRLAAINEDIELVWELLGKGQDIRSLYNTEWRTELRKKQPRALHSIENVIDQIKAMEGHGRDQPTTEDNLGRDVFADGIAALFLNRFIESPITVGISGQWGMGKSSVMIQTQKILLMTAAKLAFPNIFPIGGKGVRKIDLSKKGRNVYEKVKIGAKNLLQQRNRKNAKAGFGARNLPPQDTDRDKNPLVKLLNEYNPQDDDVYKSLACMDIEEMLDSNSQNTLSVAFSEIPRILTVQYNAWHYRNEVEAWAGLAVTITKAIEASMTRSQWISACFIYSWNKNRRKIFLQVILPCLLAAFIGLCIFFILLVIKHGKFEKLKYGSLLITIIGTFLTLVQRVLSVVKPVSTQMMGYITPPPDHTSRLGYQEEVIDDIKFLTQEVGRKPNPFFSILSGDWHCFNFWDNVRNTSIPKLKPASNDRLRIITFVDDLDRCDEKVILEVLSAINLVLAECKINVILGMDMEMITRAISSNYNNSKDKYLAEKFISKIVQIPLSLPDPAEEEFDRFLGHEVGHKLKKAEFDGEDTDDDEQEPKTNKENENGSTNQEIVVDIPDSFSPQLRNSNTLYAGIKMVYGHVCNIARRLQFRKTQPDDKNMSFEVFSDGARLVRRSLLSNFSREEVDTINKLKSFATGNRKFPREWKRLMYYYKLAFNILSRRGHVYSLSRWKEELLAWIFVCWQWEEEMNTLIQGWRNYVYEFGDSEPDGNRDQWSGPSLGDIVTNCIAKTTKAEESSTATSRAVPDQGGSVRGSNNLNVVKLRGSLRPSNATLCLYENNEDIDEEDTSMQNWHKLQEALGIQDVSMKGIQLFQQFRFYCETDHLPWPLPEEIKKKEN